MAPQRHDRCGAEAPDVTADKPTPLWQKAAAGSVLAALVAAIVAFRSRLGADFWPLDSSRVGPNLIASAITWAALFSLGVLLYPPFRRRVHRFMDGKLASLHEHHKRAAEHNEWAARQIARMHFHVTGMHADQHPHHADIGRPKETP